MKKRILFLFAAICLFSVFSCNDSNEANLKLDRQNNLSDLETSTRMQYYPPWVFVMDWRFSRGTCATGPGVCFQNYDGDILGIGTDASVGDFFYASLANNSDPDAGVVALKMEDEQLNLIFSSSLEEETLIIEEDVILHKKICIALGVESITIPQGEYSLSFENYEYGQASVSVDFKEYQLDYHSEYGEIAKMDYKVEKGFELEDFLETLNISEGELQSYNITEFGFSGNANAEHLIDGQIVNVWHEYQEEPAVLFEGVLNDGSPIVSSRILGCGNPNAEEYHAYILKKYAWFFFGY